jgi:hypothetical protein
MLSENLTQHINEKQNFYRIGNLLIPNKKVIARSTATKQSQKIKGDCFTQAKQRRIVRNDNLEQKHKTQRGKK